MHKNGLKRASGLPPGNLDTQKWLKMCSLLTSRADSYGKSAVLLFETAPWADCYGVLWVLALESALCEKSWQMP